MRKIKPKKSSGGLASVSSKLSDKPIFPTIRIDLEHLPEAKKWKVGSTYCLTLDLKMVGLSQSRYQNEAEFEIHGIEVCEPGESDDEEEYKDEPDA